MTKKFKVAQIGKPDDNGLCSYILIAENGECWQVHRDSRGPFPVPWQMGEVVEIEIVMVGTESKVFVPHWESLGCERPILMDLSDPHSEVAKWWGIEMANLYCEPMGRAKRLKKPTSIFPPDCFMPSPLDTPDMKAKLVSQFIYFSDHGFEMKYFPDSLYEKLSQMFGFKPLSSRVVFGKKWFSSSDRRLAFAHVIAQFEPVGEPTEGLVDVERAIRTYVISKVLGKLGATSKRAEDVKERKLLRALLLKHGLPPEFKLSE